MRSSFLQKGLDNLFINIVIWFKNKNMTTKKLIGANTISYKNNGIP
jgi:hypothetical protein